MQWSILSLALRTKVGIEKIKRLPFNARAQLASLQQDLELRHDSIGLKSNFRNRRATRSEHQGGVTFGRDAGTPQTCTMY